MMNFEEAIKRVDNGEKITRLEWKGSSYLEMTTKEIMIPSTSQVTEKRIISQFLEDCMEFQLDAKMIQADDWVMVGDETETPIKFIEAVKLLLMKQKIKLKEWKPTTYLKLDPLGRQIYMRSYRECPYIPVFQDFTATDWEIFTC